MRQDVFLVSNLKLFQNFVVIFAEKISIMGLCGAVHHRAALDLIWRLRRSDDGYLPHIPNAETAAAIREGRSGDREKVTIDQIIAELNAGN